MAIYFADSSALVKRYVSEVASGWVLELFNPTFNHEVFIAAVTGVEIVAAITRRARGGSISNTDATAVCHQLRGDLQTDYQIIQITEGIISAGMTLAETYRLRGYDAIQLAAGCAVNELCMANNLPPLILVLADHELNIAASNQGLAIENPNL
jgi:uncharacterized protein